FKQRMTSETVSENVEEVDDTLPPEDCFTVEALKIIKEAQQQHGLRHGDFQRYRGYCARRIRRLRKSLNFPQGNKHRNVPKKITLEHLTDARFLYLPLVEAERAWSQAMQLKSEANTEPRKKFHMSSRLKKAVQHSQEFVKLTSSDKCDARTKLEAQAYDSWINGTLKFELGKWKQAIEDFTNAKTIYEKLASALSEDVRILYTQRVEEISPNIRYCAYNIGDETAMNDLVQMRLKSGGMGEAMASKLDELIAQTREKQAASFSELQWRGRTVPVGNEQVRAFLLNLQESEKELQETEDTESKVSIYESLLKECIEALQVMRDELKGDPHFKAAQRGQTLEGKVSNGQYLHTHITYSKLTKTIERNLIMIETMKEKLKRGEDGEDGRKARPQDLARLYDIIIQSASEIPQLPGLEEDDALSQEISGQIQGYRAFRCFFIAQTYATAKKWKETIALYEKVLLYADKAIAELKSLPASTENKVMKTKLEELKKEVDGLKYSSHASSILEVEDVTTKVGAVSLNNKPLIDRLEEYVDDAKVNSKKANLANFPPDFQPVQCKPLFFDLALNHVDLPSLESKVETNQKGKPSGITGLVKGWLWGGKK
ncbi:unnamed protein product, partial [Owenia fusiformis]